jgi:hypothetical protein
MSKPVRDLTPAELFAEYWAGLAERNKGSPFNGDVQAAFYAGMAAAGAQWSANQRDDKSTFERVFGK